MKNLLLSMTILAIFLSVNNIAFAQDYDSTKYLQDLKEVEKSRQQYIQTYHQQQVQNTRYNPSNYSSGNTRRDLADIVNRRSDSNYLK